MDHSDSDELLIARLFDLPAAERASYWERVCAENPGLRDRSPAITRVLAAGGNPLPPLAPVPLTADAMVSALESALSPVDQEAPGTRIGPYKLLQKIGEGGFGAVWMAEQSEPLRRRVALKIIKIGMDTEEVIARFEAERQALALMDHPNIARVFDAGATASGRPFFVMELVRGVAITRYCDENRLTAEARLRLFIPVCQAVQHAHQKGVIHRDLKPSNILVTLHDGVPVSKIIDFGIAKATDKQLTEKTLVTQFHAFVGTPVYTSPEQMEMSGLDVDTRSDIYSLGVLLYELLAGRPPFDPDALVKSGLDAMRRTIREVDPPRPSYRLGTLSEADRTSVAHQRGSDVAKLTLLLRGDVDWIVMHCLEKDRTRRYETAAALAADIQHYLASEPVTARPPSELYRTRKFIRRHRVGVAATVAVALSLLGGLIASSTLFVRERAAHTRAVVAEQSENRLRQQAETARTLEAKRVSHTSQALAEQLLQEGRTGEGLAHLVRAARSDPENYAIGPRLIAALAYRSYAEPVGAPIAHSTPLWGAGYCKDGRRCWTWAHDDSLRIWRLGGEQPERVLNFPNPAWSDFSPDETRVAVGGTDGLTSIWSLETGSRVLGPLRHEQRVGFVSFSPDGKWLGTASDDHTAKIWDAATGELKAVLSHEYPLAALAFSPDSTRLLTTTLRGPWRIWRVPGGDPVTPFGTSDLRSNWGSFSPDGKLVVVPDNSGAQLFDAATGKKVGARLQHLNPCYNAWFSPDGAKVVTTSDDQTARLWEVPSGKPQWMLQHGGAVRRACFTPDGRYLVTHSREGMARVWDLQTGRLALEPIRVGDVKGVDLAPDGREFLTFGGDGTVRRWQLAPSEVIPFQLPPDPSRLRVQPDPSGTTTAWTIHRDHLQQIDLLTGRPIGPARSFLVPIDHAPLLSPDANCLFVFAASGEWELWDLRHPEIVRHPLGPFPGAELGDFRRRSFSRDSSRFALLDNSNSVRVWDSNTGTLLAGPIENAVQSLDFSPGGRLLATGLGDYSVVIWDLSTGIRVGEPLRHRGPVRAVCFSPDGRLVATGPEEGDVQLWDVKTTRPVGPPLPHRNFLRGLAFTRDSRRLLTWTPLDVRVWDVATGAPLTEPMVADYNVQRAVFSEDETRIATCNRTSGEVRLWGSVSGQLLADAMKGMSTMPSFFGFLGNGQFLAQAHLSGRLLVWPIPPQSRRQPVPGWLLQLVTAVAGGEIDARAVFREQAFDVKSFDEIRRELAALPVDAPYAEWGRWILADRATRPIGPGFTVTRAEMGKSTAAATFDPPDSP